MGDDIGHRKYLLCDLDLTIGVLGNHVDRFFPILLELFPFLPT
jgi:hypothetical protein